MKAYDITTPIAQLKSDNVQHRNKIYIAVVVFYCRLSIATESSAQPRTLIYRA